MFITLECSNCGAVDQVPYRQLVDIWRQGYAKAPPRDRPHTRAVTEIKCHCGHHDRYDAPMVNWVFQTLFDEFVKETVVV